MAIKDSDSFNNSLYSEDFGTAGPTTESMTYVSDSFRATKTKTDIIIYATGLNADAQVTFKSGNTLTFAELGPMLDANNVPIVVSIPNGVSKHTVNINSFVIGFYFETLGATTGTVKIIAAL